MLALIPLFPLIGFVINAALGRRLPKAVSGAIASAVMVASFAVSVMSVLTLVGLPVSERVIEQTVYTWIASGDFVVDMTLRLDPLAAVMILVVTGIGALIHIYSTAYMHEEVGSEFARYFSYLNLFAAFMLVLVLGANFLVMFVGWEGVGLCSYLLIGFWFKRKSAADAGKKAFVVNRTGDYAFVLGMLLLVVRFGTLDFRQLASVVAALPPEQGMFGVVSIATLLLFIGATGKSAQIPLYTWLPDAMEGPTPVSALIHAATMVTAGVYMIGRNAVLFSHAPATMLIVAIIGALTALMAGTIGLVQNDIKRVLAYSTVSQLGLMFLAMGMGAFGAGIFHLYTHAFFKALLFLGSGAVIHALHGEQDIRNMGGLRRYLPITYWTFLIGSLAIAGIPGLAGFFSKDEILYATYHAGHWILWTMAAVTSLLTATYMFRLVFLTFYGERREASHLAPSHLAPSASHLHDAPPAMALVLIVLAIGSAVAGYVGVPSVLGGQNRLGEWLEPSFRAPGETGIAGDLEFAATAVAAGIQAEAGVTGGFQAVTGVAGGLQAETAVAGGLHAETAVAGGLQAETAVAGGLQASGAETEAETEDAALELRLMAISSAIAIAGIALAAFIWLRRRDLAAAIATRFRGLYRLLLNKYYVDEVYDVAIVKPIRAGSEHVLWQGVDVGVIDGAVNGAALVVATGSGVLRRLQTGSVRAYAGSMFIGVIVILGYYLWR